MRPGRRTSTFICERAHANVHVYKFGGKTARFESPGKTFPGTRDRGILAQGIPICRKFGRRGTCVRDPRNDLAIANLPEDVCFFIWLYVLVWRGPYFGVFRIWFLDIFWIIFRIIICKLYNVQWKTKFFFHTITQKVFYLKLFLILMTIHADDVFSYINSVIIYLTIEIRTMYW